MDKINLQMTTAAGIHPLMSVCVDTTSVQVRMQTSHFRQTFT